MSKSASGVNLTYVTNAVRSLMAYERKRKNAVPKSIKRILAEYGLAVEWRMNCDRLSRPQLYPDVEAHLGFVPRNITEDPFEFTLPRASARLASMLQAVFDFGSSGHGTKSEKDGQAIYTVGYCGILRDISGKVSCNAKRCLKKISVRNCLRS